MKASTPVDPFPVQDEITVVICAKNEAGTIGSVVRRSLRYTDDVLAIDGHSSDETVCQARDAGASVIVQQGQGKGCAVRSAFHLASRAILVLIDADLSHDPDDIPALVGPILRGEADLVIASRLLGGSDEFHSGLGNLIRFVGSWLITYAINLRWKVQLTDSQNGFRAIRRDLACRLPLRSTGFTVEQEMVMQCLRLGYRVSDVPSHESARARGKSHIAVARVWPLYLWSLLMCCCQGDKPKRGKA